jgi:hypothetical protein
MKNYTSRVPAEKSLGDIEKLLVKAGARSISKEYGSGGEVLALNFVILSPETNAPLGVRLPANPEAVAGVLLKGQKNATAQTKQRIRDQARRTAWRLMFDWVAVQLSLIEMKQAELLQVFLPYVWSGRGSFYAQLRETKFAALINL